MSRSTGTRGTPTGRRITLILAGLFLTAGAVAVWTLLVSEYGMGSPLTMAGWPALLCFGLLLGAFWTSQSLQPQRRQLAEERRRLNEEWAAVHTAVQHRGRCPRCSSPLAHRSPGTLGDQKTGRHPLVGMDLRR